MMSQQERAERVRAQKVVEDQQREIKHMEAELANADNAPWAALLLDRMKCLDKMGRSRNISFSLEAMMGMA